MLKIVTLIIEKIKLVFLKFRKNHKAYPMSKLKPGQKVKVLRRAEYGELGWQSGWTSQMDRSIGEILVVRSNDSVFGVICKGEHIYATFPSYVLDVVEPHEIFIKHKPKKYYRDAGTRIDVPVVL